MSEEAKNTNVATTTGIVRVDAEVRHDPGEFRHYRTEAYSQVTVRKGHGVTVDFDWFEEDHACIDCEIDMDATRDHSFQDLIWRCEVCGGGSAPLEPFTP